MVMLHVDKYPLHRDLFNVPEEEIEGEKFKDWQTKANYFIRVTIVMQLDSTNVSTKEKEIAPNLTFITVNQAIINIYRTYNINNVSFEKFQNEYARRELALERYVEGLILKLNSARNSAGMPGSWYINYSLNERHIELGRPTGE